MSVPLLLLVLCFARLVRAQRELCQSEAPDQALVDTLTVCRGLNYPFCVLRAPGDTRTDLAEVAVELDRNLADRYQTLAPLQSQRCVHAWINKVCSETFPPLQSAQTGLCGSVCTELREHCIGLECGDVAGGPDCLDFFAEISTAGTAQCFSSDDAPAAPTPRSPDFPPARPRDPVSEACPDQSQFWGVRNLAIWISVAHFGVGRI